MLVLEELEHASERGAKIYAELAGYGVSSDAEHITEPDPTGESAARAMRMAFADAGHRPDEIDYINAHGTSTPLGDASETRVIKLALGEDAPARTSDLLDQGRDRPLSRRRRRRRSDLLHARDPHGVLPPTINYETPDPECDLDYIPNEAREADVRIAVSNSFGFGGHNACLVLRRFDR